jgi:hypothetical protein
VPVQIHSKPSTHFRTSRFSALRLGVVAVVEKRIPDSAVQDFAFDDAPRHFEHASDSVDDGPFWLWALVRESSDPRQQVWVRYGAEEVPAECYVQAAGVPTPGSTGVRIVTELAAEHIDTRVRRSRKPRRDDVPEVPANARLLTTPAAARYCGFKSSSGLRKASKRGEVNSVGRRGGTGPLVWSVEELDRFMEHRHVDEVGEAVGLRDLRRTGPSGRVRGDERRLPAAGQGDGSENGAHQATHAGRPRRVASTSDRSTQPARRKGSKRVRLNEATDAALLRIRRLAHGGQDQNDSDS